MPPTQLRPRSLQARFLLGLGLLIVLLGAIFAASLYFQLQRLLTSQVSNQADVVLGQVDAVQSYVRQVLRPRMFELLPPDHFVLEGMSTSFISRQVMERLGAALPGHLYRRVSAAPRNPGFAAEGVELELLAHFQEQPQAASWSGYKTIDGEQYFLKARPVRFEQSCLNCHGRPEDAPRELIERYGDSRGFGRQLGELGGLDVVGVPIRGAVDGIKEATFWFVVIFVAGMLAVFGIIQFFFHRLVAVNLGRLTGFFQRTFQEGADPGLLERLGPGDQIEEMVAGMEELGRHLYQARRQLEEHAAGLERRVAERTAELSREAAERRADVELFVSLLDGMSRSRSRMDLLKLVLPGIGMRFHAGQAGFLCSFSQDSHYSWPDPQSLPVVPGRCQALLMDGQPVFEERRALLPVTSQEVVQGVLSVAWDQAPGLSEMDRQVMMALAHQLGIALENLTALDSLLTQRDILHSIFEGVSDPMALLDAAGRVVTANQAAQALAGEGDLLGRLLDGDPQGPAALLGQALDSGGPAFRELALAGGRLLRLTLYPLTDPHGRPGRLVAYARDITMEKRMQAEMQRSERLVAVGELAAGLAHEINNPLGTILCYAELLESGLKDDQQRRDLEVIVRHTRQAQQVLKDLLDFARAERGRPSLVDLAQMARRAAQVLAPQAEGRGARLALAVGGATPLVSADPRALDQILTNLVLNALDAVPRPGGLVTLGAGRDEAGQAYLEVADNGPGVDPAHLDLIFNPFFTTKEVGKGTGLGLAVVYGLVCEMGGTISVRNRGGAVFTVHLPPAGEADHA